MHYESYTIDQQTYLLAADATGLLFVGSPNAGLSELRDFYPHENFVHDGQFTQDAAVQLAAYLRGQRQAFEVPLSFLTGTALQQAVWRALMRVPYGQTISYTQLAAQVEAPKAVRAVATAVAKNPFLIVVPCHRVVRKNGAIGQYRAGVALKQTLLELEATYANK
ncbi:MAG TPA: methylated-DNA--[protein]-cysteine S-methyltransferase [Lactobacillaceae bacterium]|jgi:O-6-methylguanine DNA methyltransferase